MTIFLSLAFLLSALALGIAHAMEAGAIRNRINGANGFVLTMVLLASAGLSVVVALIAGLVSGLSWGLSVLGASAAWHFLIFTFSLRRLTRLARDAR